MSQAAILAIVEVIGLLGSAIYVLSVGRNEP